MLATARVTSRSGDRTAEFTLMLPFAIRHLFGLSPHYREVVAYRPKLERAAAELRRLLPAEVVDELAIPSYTHSNRLMRHLFWQRLAVALEWLDGVSPRPERVLDFGCGVGIMFPLLSKRGIKAIGCDIHPEAAELGAQVFGLAGVEVLPAGRGLGSIPSGSVGAILALDVLEHVGNVPSLASEFARILGAQGRLLCSLPTENLLYRIGRKLAGFSGAYHVRSPSAALAGMRCHLEVAPVARLYSFAPFFDFFEAQV